MQSMMVGKFYFPPKNDVEQCNLAYVTLFFPQRQVIIAIYSKKLVIQLLKRYEIVIHRLNSVE